VTISAHRKVVTVLFCDVVGSTALGESVDPEALQGLLARYFERMKAIVESHGGSVEKFIGDAVMAVFGVPVAHEDDALRACRAAVEMRDALPELGVEGRIGVNTGEVLAGTEERLATGDAVNVAARLEQAAAPGEILVGAETLGLVVAGVEVGDELLLELKGKSGPIAAHLLVSIRDASERSHASRFVGRELELQQLAHAWERALTGSRSELVTVVGDPGVGKSRLVAEALARIDARIVRGRCLSYGDGITYWPVVEVVKQLDALPSDEQAANAIRSLLREREVVAGKDEIAWAFRKLLEEQAPLVVCFDDIQWGEETFLDLVESTALLSTGAPLLLVCMSRPELLDRRPTWPATLRLESLPPEQAGELVGAAVPKEVREQIVRASGGNPLFLTELAALSQGGGEVEVPPTLRALLAMRLDQLDEPERGVLERGAVEGELFHRGTVRALAPEETEVMPQLAALVRRDLIRPDRPQLPRQDAYRFSHLLIRDAAYDALPKAARADLHQRFAGWLEEHGQSLVELDEILGYHLEQAAGYLDELGRPDPEVALAAGDRLAAAGRQALWRGDDRAGARVLGRALELTRPWRLDVNLELDLAACLLGDARKAMAIAEQAADRAAAAGEAAGEALARAVTAFYEDFVGSLSAAGELEALALKALPLLEQAEDHAGLVHLWTVLGLGVANHRWRFDDWARADSESARHARLAGRHVPTTVGVPQIYGSQPASEALATLEGEEAVAPFPALCHAWLLAMLGRFDEAWPLADEAYARAREQSGNWIEGWAMAEISGLAGDHEMAARLLEEVCEWLDESGQPAFLASYSSRFGLELCALGRYQEAEDAARRTREFGIDHPWTDSLWRQIEVRVHCSRGEHAEAERLALETVEVVGRTDGLWWQADVYADLGEALELAGKRDEAIAAWQEALGRYERKEIVPLARRVRERMAALEPV
jgi:class 3 adenylate cyclase